MRVVFVHGACVRNGDWWWRPTSELLFERDIISTALKLPSCGETGARPDIHGPGLEEDARALREVLAACVEPTIVAAHSYGGIVASEGAAGIDNIHHLLLIASYLPETGESLSTFGDDQPAAFLDIDLNGGTFTVCSDALASTFLQDCSLSVQRQAIQYTARQSLAVLEQPVTSTAWREIPTTYVVCKADKGTPPDLQREFARRASQLVEVDAGHHPFISRPDVIRDLIVCM